MDTQTALLRAIIEEPHDDTHRLVFADWLEDDGQGAWAALIRAQCALSRCLVEPDNPFTDATSVPASALRPPLRRLVLGCLGELIDRSELDGSVVGDTMRRFHCRVRRGFLEQITIHGGSALRRFVSEAREVFLRTPLVGLVLENYVPRSAEASYEYYNSDHDPQDRAAFEALLRLPSFGQLRALDLRSLHLNSPWTRLLLRQAPMFQTTTLHVHGWRIGDQARAERLRERFGERLVIQPEHPGDQALHDDIPF